MTTLTSRYSQHARRAMTHARLLAREQRHGAVDTSHLLIGILRAVGSIGHRVLQDLETDLAALERQMEIGELHERLETPPTPLPLTPELRDTLALAVEESVLLGHHYIGTEHLLLGLARGNKGAARALLHVAGISPDQIRRQVRRALQVGPTEISLEAARRLARLSQLSLRVISRATQIAQDMNHAQPDLAHLLLALAREERGPVSGLLHECGLDQARLAEDLARRAPNVSYGMEGVLDEAVRRAEHLGSHYTATDHIALALARDRRGARLLKRYGVSLERLVVQLRERWPPQRAGGSR